MVSTAGLKSILANGRSIDGAYKNYIRTMAPDGFSRLYKIVNDEPIFVRAAKTFKIEGENGTKIIGKRKVMPLNKNKNSGIPESQIRDTARKYDLNNNRTGKLFSNLTLECGPLKNQQIKNMDPTSYVELGNVSRHHLQHVYIA